MDKLDLKTENLKNKKSRLRVCCLTKRAKSGTAQRQKKR